MVYDANELKSTAVFNKQTLKKQFFNIPVNKFDYKFKIGGVGNKAIRIEKYFYYSEIIQAVLSGNENGFEFLIEQIVVDPSKKKKPKLENPLELKERAWANKQYLKSQYLNVFIGDNEYEFRISGIGGKSIKIELFMGYDDIASALNSGNDVSLEFILKELIVGNDVDYDKFYSEQPIEKPDDEIIEIEIEIEDEDEKEIDSFDLVKLTEEELDEISSTLKGWEKLVFDAIDDLMKDEFTSQELLEQPRIESYKVKGESLDSKVNDNLIRLEDLGLIKKISKNSYFVLW